MRQSYLEILPKLTLHSNSDITTQQLHDIINSKTTSAHQNFFQTLVRLYLVQKNFPAQQYPSQAQKDQMQQMHLENILQIQKIEKLQKEYIGSLSLDILKLNTFTHYLSTAPSMLDNKQKTFPLIRILHNFRKKNFTMIKQFDILTTLLEPIEKGLINYESYIVYLDLISLQVLKLIFSRSSQLKIVNLVYFLRVSLPKILSNIIVSTNMFPNTLIESRNQIGQASKNIDILYSNQILENTIKMCANYHKLIHKIMIQLFQRTNQETAPSIIKQLVGFAIKYYYIYHKMQEEVSELLLFQAFRKMIRSVQYAIVDELFVFFIVVRKLGKQKLIQQLMREFQWAKNIYEIKSSRGIQKQSIMPYYNKALGNTQYIVVSPSQIQYRYIQIYDRFSLLYFSIKCIEYDIKVKLYFVGGFDKPAGHSEPSLIFSLEKDDLYQGSLQILQPGIYLFEFDNQYSWTNKKVLTYDVCIFSPLQIIQNYELNQNIKDVIFSNYSQFNQCSYDHVIGHIHHTQMNGAPVVDLRNRMKVIEKQNEKHLEIKVLNLKIRYINGKVYEYQTENSQIYIDKVRQILRAQKDVRWKIEGYGILNTSQVQSLETSSLLLKKINEWINNQYHPKNDYIQFKNKKKLRITNSPLNVQKQQHECRVTEQQEIQLKSIESSQNDLRRIQKQQQEEKL